MECTEVLRHEHELSQEHPLSEVMILTVDTHGAIRWSFSSSDDVVKLLGYLELTRLQVLDRLAEYEDA